MLVESHHRILAQHFARNVKRIFGLLGAIFLLIEIPLWIIPGDSPPISDGVVDSHGFYNAAGWGPAIVANIPPLIWFFAASIAMIRKSHKESK